MWFKGCSFSHFKICPYLSAKGILEGGWVLNKQRLRDHRALGEGRGGAMSRSPPLCHIIPYWSPALEGGETGRVKQGGLGGLLCPGPSIPRQVSLPVLSLTGCHPDSELSSLSWTKEESSAFQTLVLILIYFSGVLDTDAPFGDASIFVMLLPSEWFIQCA